MNTTGTHFRQHAGLRTALAIVLTGLVAAVAATAAPAGTSGTSSTARVGTLRLLSTTITATPHRFSYTWPLKPFDRQHPVRAFLDDPRIAKDGSSKSFHFGIDIAAPDLTGVYAVEAGTVFLDNPEAVAVVAPDGHTFGYWHIVPVVKPGQFVHRHQLLGRIGKGWEHVHFAERVDGAYVNPLRAGGLGPYADHTAPRVASIGIVDSNLIVRAYDMPDPVVPGAWTNLPVTPAVIRWRVAGGSWHTALDSRGVMKPRADFASVFTPAIRQNRKGRAGNYSYYLARGWNASRPVWVQVAVSDTAGNGSVVTALVGAAV